MTATRMIGTIAVIENETVKAVEIATEIESAETVAETERAERQMERKS